jgi:SAM-dependent methyltransferase
MLRLRLRTHYGSVRSQTMQKPKHLTQEYGDQFQDLSVAASYRKRPVYGIEVIETLSDLIDGDSGSVLDVGCGTGEIAIPLSRRGYKVDAVDPSHAMLNIAKGDVSNVKWHCAYAEQFEFSSTYDLICCANSLHWMDWDVLFPKFSNSLSENGFLALVSDGDMMKVPNSDDIIEVIQKFSTNQDFQPFSLIDVMRSEGFFKIVGSTRTDQIAVVQPISDYIESFHARNGLSVERMGREKAREFDLRILEIINPHLKDGMVNGFAQATVTWGDPIGF